MKYIKELLQIVVLFTILIGVLHAQDSTAIQLKIDEQIELRNTIQSQRQIDLGKIDYAIFVLQEMLKPPKEEEEKEEEKE